MSREQNPSDADVYRRIAHYTHEVMGPCAVGVGSYDPEANTATARAVLGLGPLARLVSTLTGCRPQEWTGTMPADTRQRLLSGKVHRVPGGLYDVLFRQVPPGLAGWGEKLCGVSAFYAAGVVSDDRLLATVVFGQRNDVRPDAARDLEGFLTQTADELSRTSKGERP